MAKAQKVLVCGDVCGQFDKLFKRVNSVNQKAGPFNILICAGDFFSEGDNTQWAPYKNGSLKVPITTFVLGPTKEGHQQHYPDVRGGELAENVIYLGPSGIYPSSSGLRVAYLSGAEKGAALKQGYTNQKVGELEAEGRQAGVVDILVTRQWPSSVATFAAKPPACTTAPAECPLVARLAHSLRPRYHFAAGGDGYYERLPYRNHQVLQEPPRQCTRFLGLASVGSKSKWLYAFTITPATHCSEEEVSAQAPDVTECPYSAQALPAVVEDGGELNPFFYGGGNTERGKKRDGDQHGRSKEKRQATQPTGPCWFCLSSPEVEKHLVVCVGKHTYLAMAKGGMVPHHLMLLPIDHYQTSLDLEKEAAAELARFKSSLREMFAASDRTVVFYERNYRTSHMQVHAVPLPEAMAGSVKEAFVTHGERQDLPLEEVPRRTELSAAVSSGQPFLFVEPPHGLSLLHRVKRGYNMRFDREVLASKELLNLPDRVDWKECKSSVQEETEARGMIRQMFAPFNFTANSDDDDSSSSSDSSDGD